VPDNATILVVDDEADVRHVIQQALERHGYRVLTAPEGSTAVRIMHEHDSEVGLVLLDLTMPGLSARDTLAALHAADARVPVILMSGYSEARATSEFGGAAIAGFLQKPFSTETLLGYIHKLAPVTPAHGAQ
jgi:DNA-binding NtrC family response regulator